MKKLALIFVITTLLFSCDIPLFQKKIVIKGKISQSAKLESSRVRSSENAYTLADATKVLIFYGTEYDLVEIKDDGTFSGKAPAGTATVLAFLTADNQFIGNLFAGGLNMLPLVGLGDVSSIDLSTLTLDGTRVIPANDPIGTTIHLTGQEIAFIREVGTYYESLAKNIDANNDGQPDILTGTDLRINTLVDYPAGKWGLNETEAVLIDTAKLFVNYTLRIEGSKKMFISEDNVKLTGPQNDPYAEIINNFKTISSDGFQYYYRIPSTRVTPDSPSSLPFKNGTYTFSLSSEKKYTFNYSNVNMRNYMVIVVPTFYTDNSKGAEQEKLIKIKYKYQLLDGSEVNPRNMLISRIRIQVNDIRANQLYEGYELYSKINLDNYNYYEEKLPTPIDYPRISQINIGYIDLLGNEYNIIWRNDMKTSY